MNDINTIKTIDTTAQQPANPFDLNGMFLNFLTHAVMQANAPLLARIAVLEEQMIAKQDSIDERIKEIADEVAREVLYEHNEEYDHDGYDRLEERIEDKVNDAIGEYDFDAKIKDVLDGASLSINV